MRAFEVLDGGLYSTVQDTGRSGWGHLGVRHAGVADPVALAAANVLAGAPVDAPVLEMTLLGGTGPRLVLEWLAANGEWGEGALAQLEIERTAQYARQGERLATCGEDPDVWVRMPGDESPRNGKKDTC